MFDERASDAGELNALVQFIQDERPELFLYDSATCVYCYRVRRVIERLKLSVQLLDVDTQPKFRKELVAARGRGTVPVLRLVGRERSVLLPESADIIALLERAYASRH
jgi:glutathione S-transferase